MLYSTVTFTDLDNERRQSYCFYAVLSIEASSFLLGDYALGLSKSEKLSDVSRATQQEGHSANDLGFYPVQFENHGRV